MKKTYRNIHTHIQCTYTVICVYQIYSTKSFWQELHVYMHCLLRMNIHTELHCDCHRQITGGHDVNFVASYNQGSHRLLNTNFHSLYEPCTIYYAVRLPCKNISFNTAIITCMSTTCMRCGNFTVTASDKTLVTSFTL